MASLAIGTTRNLTQQFLRHRNDVKRVRFDVVEERAGADAPGDKATAKLLGASLGGGSDVELGAAGPRIAAGYAPRWMHASERIKSEMVVVRERITKLREYHAKALLVSFGDAAGGVGGGGGGGAGAHVDAVTREVQLAFKRLDGEVRALGGAGSDGGGGGGDDAGVRLQVQRQLAQALFKLSVEFRKEETRFLNKIEAQRGYEAGSSIGLVEDEGAGGGGDAAAADPGFTQAQLTRMSQAEALIEERDTEIRKVVETIVELATIMRDLSTLVVEQGTMLDRIDHNIQETAMKVEEGVKELVKAEQTQKSGRALQCIALLCVLIALFLIITIVRHA
ncbi:MAG: Qa-snare protein, Tlg2/Syntaxin16-family [Monoraphidium minutum]|nr:MAG: Qa-snare protein, Tlg2/Syntaxin16-family [Monoraphidium minutum]